MLTTMTFAGSVLLAATQPAIPPTIPAVLVQESVASAAPESQSGWRDVGTNRTWIAKDRVRVEMGNAVQIYDANAGLYISIDERTKTYYAVPAGSLHAAVMVAPASMIGLTADEEGDPLVPANAFRKTARVEIVEGRRASVWEATQPDARGGRTTLWIATGLPAVWSDLQNVVRAVFVGDASPMASWFEQASKMDGWPVRIEHAFPGRRQRIQLRTAERTTVDRVLFEAPGGYTRVSDPSGFTLASPPASSIREERQ